MAGHIHPHVATQAETMFANACPSCSWMFTEPGPIPPHRDYLTGHPCVGSMMRNPSFVVV